MNSTNIEPTPAELERQKDAFIDKLIEIVREQEKISFPDQLEAHEQNIVAE